MTLYREFTTVSFITCNLYSLQLEAELDSAVENILPSLVNTDPELNVIILSPIFKWFSKDFGRCKEDRLKWIRDRLLQDLDKKSRLVDIMNCEEGFSIKYSKDFDWHGNEKKEN